MGVSGVSGGSSAFESAAAAQFTRTVSVLKKQQDEAKAVGEALVQLISQSAPKTVGSQISVYA